MPRAAGCGWMPPMDCSSHTCATSTGTSGELGCLVPGGGAPGWAQGVTALRRGSPGGGSHLAGGKHGVVVREGVVGEEPRLPQRRGVGEGVGLHPAVARVALAREHLVREVVAAGATRHTHSTAVRRLGAQMRRRCKTCVCVWAEKGGHRRRVSNALPGRSPNVRAGGGKCAERDGPRDGSTPPSGALRHGDARGARGGDCERRPPPGRLKCGGARAAGTAWGERRRRAPPGPPCASAHPRSAALPRHAPGRCEAAAALVVSTSRARPHEVSSGQSRVKRATPCPHCVSLRAAPPPKPPTPPTPPPATLGALRPSLLLRA
eukprot:3595370-Prymnesium_polylepis.2